jgi:glyoxylase I family protein
MKLHHLAIQVQDLERARRFYVEVLGLPEVRRQPHAIWVDADGVLLMLEKCAGLAGADPWKSERAGLHLLSLAIEPMARASWVERLAAAGHALEAETDFTVYVRDPDGTRIGLSSYPQPSRG